MNRLKQTVGGGLLCITLGLTGGCGVELAVLGAAASAASSGSAAYKRGKLVASWMGPFDLVVAAGEVALSEMGYAIYRSSGDAREGEWTIVAYDDDGGKIVLTVDRKTSELTDFQIDVGWFGSEPTARLVLKRMALAIDLESAQDGTGNVLPLLPMYPAMPTPDDAIADPAEQPTTPDVAPEDTPEDAPEDATPTPSDPPASDPDRPAEEPSS